MKKIEVKLIMNDAAHTEIGRSFIIMKEVPMGGDFFADGVVSDTIELLNVVRTEQTEGYRFFAIRTVGGAAAVYDYDSDEIIDLQDAKIEYVAVPIKEEEACHKRD